MRLKKDFVLITILFFCTSVGIYMYPNNIRRIIKAMCRKTGIEYFGMHHTLRHTFVTNLFELKIHTKTISMLVRHSKVETTLKIHPYVSNENKRNAIQALNKYINSDTLRHTFKIHLHNLKWWG